MGLRFRKRVKVAPGLTFNFNWSDKKGITTSSTVGVPGANVNVGTKKDGSLGVKRGTLGIPGSGLSYHENLDDSVSKKTSSKSDISSEVLESKEPLESIERIESNDTTETTYTELEAMTVGDCVFTVFHFFAHSRTFNWLINFAILGGLFYLNQ
ncbi:hypothetical protein DR996_30825 [Vibrio owensii]|nr:hypothetical protein DR996_30825 [Vibrio owensii]